MRKNQYWLRLPKRLIYLAGHHRWLSLKDRSLRKYRLLSFCPCLRHHEPLILKIPQNWESTNQCSVNPMSDILMQEAGDLTLGSSLTPLLISTFVPISFHLSVTLSESVGFYPTSTSLVPTAYPSLGIYLVFQSSPLLWTALTILNSFFSSTWWK